MINAEGGWDPTLLCDPKGRANEWEAKPINHYFTDDIRQIGAIRCAPRGNNAAFFKKYGSQLLIVNGIDTATNNHEVGLRHSWSGLNGGSNGFVTVTIWRATSYSLIGRVCITPPPTASVSRLDSATIVS